MSQPELVVLFADADAERFVARLIERGIERKCLRSMAWEHYRDPMCDAHLSGDPLVIAKPFLSSSQVRFIVLWDHQGSGRENEPPEEVERYVRDVFQRAGVPAERVEAIAIDPELEVVLEPVWDRVRDELAAKRKQAVVAIEFDPKDPKSSLEAVAGAHNLRINPALFSDLASKLSIPQLKHRAPLSRIADRLVEWFGAAT